MLFCAVNVAKAYYERIRSEEEFDRFYKATTELADKYTIGEPVLPRYRRRPARHDSGSEPHQYPTPKADYRHLYYEACDLISNELTDLMANMFH